MDTVRRLAECLKSVGLDQWSSENDNNDEGTSNCSRQNFQMRVAEWLESSTRLQAKAVIDVQNTVDYMMEDEVDEDSLAKQAADAYCTPEQTPARYSSQRAIEFSSIRQPCLQAVDKQTLLTRRLSVVATKLELVSLPSIEATTALDDACLALVAVMRSPFVLNQLRQLLQQPLPPMTESTGNDSWLSRAASYAITIRNMSASDLRHSYYIKYSEVQLYMLLQSQNPTDMVRFNSFNLEHVAEISGWSKSQVRDHACNGRRMHSIIGGHLGLFCLIPLKRIPELGVVPRNDVQRLEFRRAEAVGQCMQDKWARSMCVLGQQLHNIVVGMDTASPELKRLLDTCHDFTCMSANEAIELLQPWADAKCMCE